MSIQIDQSAVGRFKRAELHAVVTRADGTVEDLGCIAFSDFTRWGRFKAWLRRLGGNR
jgi:hypothetical protein